MVGVANLVLMLTLTDSPSTERLIFLLLTVIILSLIPAYPIPGSLCYLALWFALLQVPHVPASDMTITNATFFFSWRYFSHCGWQSFSRQSSR